MSKRLIISISRVGCKFIWELECIDPTDYRYVNYFKRTIIRDYLDSFGSWWEGPDWRKEHGT